MADTPIRYTPETGFRRAQELIAECIATEATTLDLGNLALEVVPEELGDCVWLEGLNLGDWFYRDQETDKWIRGQQDESERNRNKLTPLAGLTELTNLNLGNNPQLPYPPEIFQSAYTSYQNLVAWDADKAKGNHPNNLFKLIICGNGTVGKTKIAKRIETDTYQEEGESTEGVQIYLTEEKEFAEGYKKVRLAIWDFAGQEIYYQLHRLFFRNRAVYLVVFDKSTWDERFQLDPKTGLKDENRSIDYWLSDIAASAGDAQIILVQNKVD